MASQHQGNSESNEHIDEIKPLMEETAEENASPVNLEQNENEEDQGEIIFTSTEVHGGQTNVSFKKSEVKSIFPILESFKQFPIILEKPIIIKSIFDSKILGLFAMISIFMKNEKLIPLNSNLLTGDQFSFCLYSLNKVKKLLQNVSDSDLAKIFQCAIFYQHVNVEKIVSRIAIHRFLAYGNRTIKLRESFYDKPVIKKCHEFKNMYYNSVKLFQSLVYHTSQTQYYFKNKTGDFVNGFQLIPNSKDTYYNYKCGLTNCEKNIVDYIQLPNSLKRKHDF